MVIKTGIGQICLYSNVYSDIQGHHESANIKRFVGAARVTLRTALPWQITVCKASVLGSSTAHAYCAGKGGKFYLTNQLAEIAKRNDFIG